VVVPRHVAIIMDGNRRWARARGLPVGMGHRHGGEAVKRSVDACLARQVRYLTLFGLSSENWGRAPAEVAELMGLLRRYARAELTPLHDRDVRVRVIGRRDRFDTDVRDALAEAEHRTRLNRRMDVIVALDYGARHEIVEAARVLARRAAAGEVDPAAIDETALAGCLYTAEVPDPDLLIRTSGEQRLSNFLLWQLAYAELVFLPVSWPEFGPEHLDAALAEYARRERRYGVDAA
jgi:undecaprenyl diphosphate synthase